MKFFAKSTSPEAPEASLSHDQKLRERCQHWISALTPEIPVLELFVVRGYFSFNPARRAANQCNKLRDIIAQIDSGEKHLRASNISHLIKNPALAPFNRDLESVWKTGQSLFPHNLSEVASWLESEKERQRQQQARIAAERKQWTKQREQQKVEQEKQAKLAQLATETGIPLDALQKLRGD